MAPERSHQVGRIVTADERSIRRSDETRYAPFPEEVMRSAFAIDDRHVVTAWHCVLDIDRPWLRLRVGELPATFRYIPLIVIRKSFAQDVAVLEIDRDRLDLARISEKDARAILADAAIPPVAGVDASWPLTVSGYPVDRSATDSMTFAARVDNPAAWTSTAMFTQLHVDALAAANPNTASGMSGGPVIATGPGGERVVVGVLVRVPVGGNRQAALGGNIIATPIAKVLDLDEIAAAIRKPSPRIGRRGVLWAAGGVVVAGIAAVVADKITSAPSAHAGSPPGSGAPTTVADGESASAAPSVPPRRVPSAGLKTATPSAMLGLSGPAYALAFATGADLLAAGGGDDRISLWHTSGDLSRASATAAAGATVQSLAFRPGGDRLASGQDDGVRLWDTSKPGRITPVGSVFGAGGGSAFAVAFSQDGSTLATGYSNNDVSLWDTSTSGVAGTLGYAGDHRGAVTGVAFGPANDLLASCSYDKTIRLWKISEHGDLRQIAAMSPNTSAMLSVAFSPDGSCLVSGGKDGNVRFWNILRTSSPVQITSGAVDVGAIVNWVAFGSDWIVAAGCDDGTVYFCDASDPAAPKEIGRRPQAAFPQAGPVHVVGFGGGGRLVGAAASYGPDGSEGAVALWRLS
jgi:WD40 repeat protein